MVEFSTIKKYEYNVDIYLNGLIVFSTKIKGKNKNNVIKNVLTNLYEGDFDDIKIEQLTLTNKWICDTWCHWETDVNDTPSSCPLCGSTNFKKYKGD